MFPGKTVFTLPVTVKLADWHRLLHSPCLSSVQRTHPPLGPRSLLFSGYRGFPGVKGPGSEADQPPTFQVDDKNTKSYSFTAPNAS